MTTNRKLGSTRHCFACGMLYGDNRRLVMHVPTMQTYCKELHDCKNPSKNIKTLIQIYGAEPKYQPWTVAECNYDAIDEACKRYYSKNAYESLMLVLGKPLRARLTTNQMLYLAKISQKYKTETVQETIIKMIDKLMEVDPDELMGKELVKTGLVDVE